MQMVFGVHKMLYTLLTIKKSIRVTALIESDLKNAFVKKVYFLFLTIVKKLFIRFFWNFHKTLLRVFLTHVRVIGPFQAIFFELLPKMHGILEKLETSISDYLYSLCD